MSSQPGHHFHATVSGPSWGCVYAYGSKSVKRITDIRSDMRGIFCTWSRNAHTSFMSTVFQLSMELIKQLRVCHQSHSTRNPRLWWDMPMCNMPVIDAMVIGWDGMGWDGMGWDGMGWDGMGWDGMGWDGMGWDGMGWDGMGWDGMGNQPPGHGDTLVEGVSGTWPHRSHLVHCEEPQPSTHGSIAKWRSVTWA